MGWGPAFMRSAHDRPASRSASRRWSAGARMSGALSEGWRAEGERHRRGQNQSRTSHVVPPFFGAGVNKTALGAALLEGSHLILRMHQTLMRLQGCIRRRLARRGGLGAGRQTKEPVKGAAMQANMRWRLLG